MQQDGGGDGDEQELRDRSMSMVGRDKVDPPPPKRQRTANPSVRSFLVATGPASRLITAAPTAAVARTAAMVAAGPLPTDPEVTGGSAERLSVQLLSVQVPEVATRAETFSIPATRTADRLILTVTTAAQQSAAEASDIPLTADEGAGVEEGTVLVATSRHQQKTATNPTTAVATAPGTADRQTTTATTAALSAAVAAVGPLTASLGAVTALRGMAAVPKPGQGGGG